MAPTPEFLELLTQLETRYGSKQAVAKAIGIKPSRYSRVRKGDSYGLKTENCLRLAHIGHWSADRVLRAAGKPDIADLLQDLYGKSLGAKHPDLLTAISDDETAAAVRSFLRLQPTVRAWIVEERRPAQLEGDSGSPRADVPTPAATAAGRTRPGRARRR